MFCKLVLLICLLVPFKLFGADTYPDNDHHLVIISIDGFPADAIDNEDLPLQNIRKLAEEGARAESMIPSNPTNTWPNHTTLVTGVFSSDHNMLHNGLLTFDEDRNAYFVDNATSRYDLVDVPTLYDAADDTGLSAAEINWPGTRDSESLDFSMPDVLYSADYITPQLQEELLDKGILREDDLDDAFLSRTPPGRDEVWNAAATHLIRKHQPNLLLHHLLNVDTSHHHHGVNTTGGYTSLAYADRHVGDIVEALEDAGIRDQTTIFIVSDHGFINVDYTLYPNVVLREHDLLETDEDGEIQNARVQVVATGGTAMVVAGDHENAEEDLQQAYELLSDLEGIAEIMKPEMYEENGLPLPEDSDQMGELFLVAEEGYGFQNLADEPDHISDDGRLIGYHGFINDYPDMETVFIASGRGINEGININTIDNRKVAPTAAKLLGIEYEIPELSPLDEILKE